MLQARLVVQQTPVWYFTRFFSKDAYAIHFLIARFTRKLYMLLLEFIWSTQLCNLLMKRLVHFKWYKPILTSDPSLSIPQRENSSRLEPATLISWLHSKGWIILISCFVLASFGESDASEHSCHYFVRKEEQWENVFVLCTRLPFLHSRVWAIRKWWVHHTFPRKAKIWTYKASGSFEFPSRVVNCKCVPLHDVRLHYCHH